MSPQDAIADLDRELREHGQTVMLRKGSAGSNSADDKAVLAFVRGFKPDELAGGVQQGDSTIILSPAGLAASGFVGPLKRGDRIVVAGSLKAVQVAQPVLLRDVVVRIELRVSNAA